MASGTINVQGITTVSSGNGSFSATTSWTYTGCSVNIPANCVYAIQGNAWYLASRPDAIAISTSDTNVNSQVSNGGNNGAMGSCSYVGYTSMAFTAYLWAKYSANGINSVNLVGWYMPK